MPSYDLQRLNRDDPTYAPGLVWRSNGHPYWRAAPRYVKAGYSLKRVELAPGAPGDALEPQRALQCRQMTREVLAWWESKDKAPIETVGWLIGRYLSDEFSPFHEVKPNSQVEYRNNCRYWQDAAGDMLIADLTFEELKGVEKSMIANGRSTDFIHRKFKMLRIIFQHGRRIRHPASIVVREILGDMTFHAAPRRQVKATREHVYAIADLAWQRGFKGFSVGIRLQFELTLRAVDVRGQWLTMSDIGNPITGGITRHGKRWADGLTWDMIGPDAMWIDKVISKTIRSMPEPIRFDLSALPGLRADILALPGERVGPVIRNTAGQPYGADDWARQWRVLRKPAGVPENVWAMDARAGAVTEADSMGVPREMLSLAAQHQDISTTARYVRNRSEQSAKVIQIRQGKAT